MRELLQSLSSVKMPSYPPRLTNLLLCILVIALWLQLPLEALRLNSLKNSHRNIGTTSMKDYHRNFFMKNIMKHRDEKLSLKFKVSDRDQIGSSIAVDEEEDGDDDDDDGAAGSVMLQRLSKGIIPIAASVGFAATPSGKLVARVAGAAAGGVAGFFFKKVIDNKIKSDLLKYGADIGGNNGNDGPALPMAVSLALETIQASNVITMDIKSLEMIAKKARIQPEDLSLFFTHALSEAIYEAVQEEGMDLTELGEIVDFIQEIGFTQAEIGGAFALAATKVSKELPKDERGIYADKYPVETLLAASKIFFLADKMLGSYQGYYGKRMMVSLSFFLSSDYQQIISESCKSLFKKCIESVLLVPDKFNPEEVEQLRLFLTTTASVSTLRPAVMQNMIMEAIQFTLDQGFAKDQHSAMTAKIDNYNSFVKAQEVLGWNSRELTATVETKTLPLFEEVANKLLNEVSEKPERAEELSDVLQERIQSLNIDERKARVFLTTAISNLNNQYMERIDRIYNVSGGSTDAVFKLMTSYARTHEAFKRFSSQVMASEKIPVPGLPFAEMVRVSIFQMQLQSKDKTAGVLDEMMSLNDAQRKIVIKAMALPKVSSWIKQCISENNFKEEAKAAYSKLLREYGATDEEWKATAVDFYYQEVARIANARAVPSSDDMKRLEEIKNFLNCEDVLVKRVNMELLGDKYVKAVTESMTPSGVITEEYVDGLERLRVRLALDKSDAESLVGVAARARLNPIVKDLVDIWKSNTDAKYRQEKEKKEGPSKKKDKSGDPIEDPESIFGYMEMGAKKENGGPSTFMRDAINLVDIISENYESQGIDISKRADSPITAVGVVPEEDLVGMFKYFLITRLSETDPEFKERYAKAEPLFAKILGLLPEGQAKAKQALAFNAYKNLLKNVLSYKPVVEAQDIQQFAILRDSLPLDKEYSDKIFDQACKSALLEHASKFMRSDSGNPSISPEQARGFREQVQSLGLEMSDIGFSSRLVTYLYALEVNYLVTNDMDDELADVQQAYDIPEEDAAEIVESTCRRYVSQMLNLALRAAKKYDEKETFKWVKEIVKYANYVVGSVDADGTLFEEADKQRLIAFYSADLEAALNEKRKADSGADRGGDDSSGGSGSDDSSTVLDASRRLKELINLTEDYVAPADGIEGLLGNVKSLAQMTVDSGRDKKSWAWG